MLCCVEKHFDVLARVEKGLLDDLVGYPLTIPYPGASVGLLAKVFEEAGHHRDLLLAFGFLCFLGLHVQLSRACPIL